MFQGIIFASSKVLSNFFIFLFSTINFAILFDRGSSQYLKNISFNSSILYKFTISLAVFHLDLSSRISRGQSCINENHLSASSICKEDNHKS
jgi:hypothetical protein